MTRFYLNLTRNVSRETITEEREVSLMEINVMAVRCAMADAGISVSELAKKAHVSQQTAVRYAGKGGNGSPTTFHKIGVALGVKPSSLILVHPEK